MGYMRLWVFWVMGYDRSDCSWNKEPNGVSRVSWKPCASLIEVAVNARSAEQAVSSWTWLAMKLSGIGIWLEFFKENLCSHANPGNERWAGWVPAFVRMVVDKGKESDMYHIICPASPSEREVPSGEEVVQTKWKCKILMNDLWNFWTTGWRLHYALL